MLYMLLLVTVTSSRTYSANSNPPNTPTVAMKNSDDETIGCLVLQSRVSTARNVLEWEASLSISQVGSRRTIDPN